MTTLSTHVLDTSTGLPASGVGVVLTDVDSGSVLAEATTDDDGRHRFDGELDDGTYRLRFAVGEHFDQTLYPWADVVFTVAAETPAHLHVPLLLSPFGYSTYRGS